MTNKVTKMAVTLLAALLLIFLYSIIFSFSAQSGEQSGSLSYMISEKCVAFFNSLAGGGWTQSFMQGLADYFEHPIRKIAHFAEYACMGVLVYTMLRPWLKRGRKLFLIVLLWVLASAAADEIHQLFVPDRWGSLADVLLDACGGAFGILLCVFTEKICHK